MATASKLSLRKKETIMNNLSEYLPFLIPVVVLQIALLVYTLHHILTHKTYKRGGRTFWLVVVIVLMQFVGPILYLLFGKEEDWWQFWPWTMCRKNLALIKS